MAALHRIVALAGILSLSCAAAQAQNLPAGITVQATDTGEVFADAAGKTLYTSELDVEPGKAKCSDEQFRFGTAQLRNIKYPLTRQENRPTCIDKLVPLQAPPEATHSGPWTILERESGLRQWMYDRKPVYTSIKDRVPGEVNGSFGYYFGPKPLHAPVAMPSGFTILRPDGGGAYFATLANTRPIVAAPRGSRPTSLGDWTPLTAPELAVPIGKWDVTSSDDGMRQWTYEGEELYLYAGFDPVPDRLPPGWHILTLARRAPLPAPFKVLHTIPGRSSSGNVVTTRAGDTIYTFACQEEGPDRLSCDDPADRAPVWTTLCGSVQRCADLFRPVVPTPNARPDGKVWSIVTIPEPWAPVRAADGVSGIKVWAYRGRPVFTYARDLRPGDTAGELGSIWKQWRAVDAGEYSDFADPRLTKR